MSIPCNRDIFENLSWLEKLPLKVILSQLWSKPWNIGASFGAILIISFPRYVHILTYALMEANRIDKMAYMALSPQANIYYEDMCIL